MTSHQDFVPPAEAARRLGVHVSTVREWVREGRVPAYRVGRRFVRLSWEELLDALRRHSQEIADAHEEGDRV